MPMHLNIQLVVADGSDCAIKISHQRFPLRPLDCVPVGIFPIPERTQRIQGPREQRNIREIVALVELFDTWIRSKRWTGGWRAKIQTCN